MADKTFTSVTLHGLPVRIELEWPFHTSEGGSDWHVVHGRVWLNDGGPLHSDVALNLAQTIKEALPSLDGDLALWVSLNSTRKALDDRQLEFLKSGKRQPVAVSSRCYSIRDKHFRFVNATPERVSEFIARKVFWGSGAGSPASGSEGGERQPVLIADPCDAQYLGASDPNMVDKLIAAAKELATRGMLELDGDHARVNDSLLTRRDEFIGVKDHALEELQLKHAYERA